MASVERSVIESPTIAIAVRRSDRIDGGRRW